MTVGQRLRHGFTIIELLIVVVVIGVLVTVVVVAYNGIQNSARDKAVLSDLEALDGIQTHYGLKNGVAGKAWYSGDGIDPDLGFFPSDGNVVDVVVSSNDYCIRIYNPASASYKTIFSAAERGTSDDACSTLVASAQAIADSPNEESSVADIAITSVVNVGNTADSASYTTPSVSLSAGKFYLMAINGRGTATPEPTVTMSGVTWSKLTSDTVNSANRLTIYYAKPSANISSTIGIDFATLQDGVRWSIIELENADTSGVNGADAIVQHASAKNIDPLTVTMTNAPSHSKNVTIGFFARQASSSYGPASGFTQINAGGQGGPNMAILAEYKLNSQTAAADGGVNTVGIAIEIAAASTTAPAPDIAYKSSAGGSTGSVNGGTVTIPVPSGVVNGDVLIANVVMINGSGTASLSTPSGWTLIDSQAVSSPNRLAQGIYYRVANNEPSSYDFSTPVDGSCCKMAGVMAAYSSVNTSAPIAGYSLNNKTTSGASVTYNNVTATANGYVVVMGGGRGSSGSLGAPTTGSYINREAANTTAASWMNAFIADGEQLASGASLMPPTTNYGANSSTLLVGAVILRQAD